MHVIFAGMDNATMGVLATLPKRHSACLFYLRRPWMSMEAALRGIATDMVSRSILHQPARAERVHLCSLKLLLCDWYLYPANVSLAAGT